MSHQANPNLEQSAEQAARDLEELLDSLSRLAASDLEPRAFHQALLEGAVRGVAAIGGAIWIRDPQGQIRVESQVQLDQLVLAQNWADAQRHTQLIDAAISGQEPRLVAPRCTLAGAPQALNPSEYLLLVSPLEVGAGAGLIEVFQRPAAAPLGQQGALSFLAAIAELAADYHRAAQLRQLQDRQSLWGQFERFTQLIHGSLEVRRVAYAVANEGRGVSGGDRLSVALVRGRRARLLAISGVDQLDRRSDSARRLEELASRVAAIGEPLWHAAGQADVAPQLQEPLQAVLDETHAQAIGVLPLVPAPHSKDDIAPEPSRGRPIGVLVVERFSGGPFEAGDRQRIQAVAQQTGVALSNALVYERVPLSGLWRSLERWGWLGQVRRLPKTVIALAMLTAAILALILIPADFDVSARGQLQPVERREVFARSDGIVSDVVKLQHGETVTAGEVLLTLRKPQLDFETSRLDGEINDAQTKLLGIQSSLTAANRDSGPGSQEKINRLSAEGEEVKALLASLKRQRTVLNQQREDLLVTSPMGGTVLTWDAAQLLAARPVARGQSLLTVANLDGPWQVEAEVPDNRIGHVLEAQEKLGAEKSQPPLHASFRLATDPGVSHSGEVQRIALATDSDKPAGSTVLVTIALDRDTIAAGQLRPGATVVVKIHCGRRCLGYVWLHEFWELVQSRVLF